MALSVQPVYDAASVMFGNSQIGGTFERRFVHTVNSLLDDLSDAADLATRIPHINSTDETIDDDELTFNILLAGCEWKLKDFGSIAGKNSAALYDRAKAEWIDKKGDFMMKKMRADRDDQDSDGNPQTDIIGLGYKGDSA